jgi:hypothetical protein
VQEALVSFWKRCVKATASNEGAVALSMFTPMLNWRASRGGWRGSLRRRH